SGNESLYKEPAPNCYSMFWVEEKTGGRIPTSTIASVSIELFVPLLIQNFPIMLQIRVEIEMQRKAVLPLRDTKSGNANQMKALCGKDMTFGPRNCKRLLGAKSPFSQQNLQRDVLDRDEETARIQYLTEIAKFLERATNNQVTRDMKAMKIRLLLVAKDTQLIDSITEKQSQIFSKKCKLFPADVQIQSIYPLPEVFELEAKLSEKQQQLFKLDFIQKRVLSRIEQYTTYSWKLLVGIALPLFTIIGLLLILWCCKAKC
ncbi:hypothetical protein S245_005725, partial [Arachis hypogaea]